MRFVGTVINSNNAEILAEAMDNPNGAELLVHSATDISR
jgi:hypothetical protein